MSEQPQAVKFDVQQVETALAGTRFAGQLYHLRVAGSTSQLALEAAAAGARTGVWVADEQTAGRGRGGHGWHSAAGDGLYVSALATPHVALEHAAKIPLAAGLAARAAVHETTGLTADIRWPNDLMFGEKKFGGILVESASDKGRLRYAVIGVGINVAHRAFPPELADAATSLHREGAMHAAREPLLAALLRHLDDELMRVDAPGGSADLLDRFTRASTWASGKRVKVGESGGYTGFTRGLDAHGFLLVEDDAGTLRTVLSGGVRSA